MSGAVDSISKFFHSKGVSTSTLESLYLTPVFCDRPQNGRMGSGVKYPEACLGDSLAGSKKIYYEY